MVTSILSRCALLLVALTLALSPMVYAAETPPELPGATVVAADAVKHMLKSGVLLVDTRVSMEFAESHITGAVNVPYKEQSRKAQDYDPAQDSFDLSKLPADKTQPVIFYCNSGECWKSYKASKAALRAGYDKIYWFRGGYPEWKKKGLPLE